MGRLPHRRWSAARRWLRIGSGRPRNEAGVVVSLTPDAAQKAGIGQDIEIELESNVLDEGSTVVTAYPCAKEKGPLE